MGFWLELKASLRSLIWWEHQLLFLGPDMDIFHLSKNLRTPICKKVAHSAPKNCTLRRCRIKLLLARPMYAYRTGYVPNILVLVPGLVTLGTSHYIHPVVIAFSVFFSIWLHYRE